MNAKHHYPPELFQLLVDAIPRLFRAKRDVLIFFWGAGVDRSVTSDIEAQLHGDRDSIYKYDIVRSVLLRLNEAGDSSLRARREVLKRVVEVEDFSMCWPEERLKAQGLVSEIRRVVNVKDAFTRMQQEREAEVGKHKETKRKEAEDLRQQREVLADIRHDLYRLFTMDNPHERGRKLEGVLNRLFASTGLLIRESFARVAEPGQGISEQIDGVIELDGHIYIVEMKWLKDPVDVKDVSHHINRVITRGGECRGLFISYSGYTGPAIAACKEALSNAALVLCTLEEFVLLLERETSVEEFLRAKIHGLIIDKQPFIKVLDAQ